MKVLLVNGSPHKNGTTARALAEVEKSLLAEGVETENFWIGVKPIGGCMGCGACAKLGRCVLADSVNECAKLLASADGFIFGTPVHYAAMAGNMTSFMDRLFFSTMLAGTGANLAQKPAAGVYCARRSGTTATLDQMTKYFTIFQMPVVSSCYWNNVYGLVAEDAEKDAEGLNVMRVLGRNMAWLLKCISLGKQNGIQPPVNDGSVRTNFIR